MWVVGTWGMMDVIENNGINGSATGMRHGMRSVGRSSSAAERRNAFEGNIGFPSDND